jgi:hypothetical protein
MMSVTDILASVAIPLANCDQWRSRSRRTHSDEAAVSSLRTDEAACDPSTDVRRGSAR